MSINSWGKAYRDKSRNHVYTIRRSFASVMSSAQRYSIRRIYSID